MNTLLKDAKKLGACLDDQQLRQFDIYLSSLILWNDKCNLTAITDADEIVNRHFVDSLTSIPLLGNIFFHKHLRVLDVGTGAGFPGLPLKIVFPEISLSLIESKTRKCLFLEDVVHKLALKNVEIINGRAEILGHNPGYRGSFDLVVSRATAAFRTLVELCLPFCKIGGFFISYHNVPSKDELDSFSYGIHLLGGDLTDIAPVNISGFKNHCLLKVLKTSPTPDKYPRRPGAPAKYPL